MDYVHWCVNPIHLALAKEIFKDIMDVKCVSIELRPWKKAVPTPHMAITSAYFRVQAIGAIREWQIGPLEGLRELSIAQINAAIDVGDWLIAFFGIDPTAQPTPSTPATYHCPELPVPPTPCLAAAPSTPAVRDRPAPSTPVPAKLKKMIRGE